MTGADDGVILSSGLLLPVKELVASLENYKGLQNSLFFGIILKNTMFYTCFIK